MYILKNAWKSIVRNKGRNILIMLIALVIAVASCIALSIRQAAETAKESTLAGMTITAQISYDRSGAMGQMKPGSTGKPGDFSGGFNRDDFDFSQLSAGALTLDEYLEYTSCLSENDGYYYSLKISLNATGDILPYGKEADASEDDTASAESSDPGKAPGGFGGMGGFGVPGDIKGNSGDFSVTGYSSYSAMLSLFGENGTHSITDGTMFDETSTDCQCVVSDEFAMYNNLSVGDVLTLANPNYEEETYDFTIIGIYTNSASGSGNSIFSFSDPANNIYMNSYALQTVLDASKEAAHTVETSSDKTVSAVLSGEITFSYLFSDVKAYEAFASAATEKLPENYTVSSQDIESFENSLTPLNTLSDMTGWFFLIVLLIGGVILIVFNIFNLRDRKYEVGVLTAIGMKKSKVALQFVTELFIITFVAIIIGAGIGAATSVPITNALLEGQIENAKDSKTQLGDNFGFPGGDFNFGTMPGGMGGMPGGMGGGRPGGTGFSKPGSTTPSVQIDYVSSVSSATNLTVLWQLILVGLLLTLVSSMAAMITIMRYEPLRILSDRS